MDGPATAQTIYVDLSRGIVRAACGLGGIASPGFARSEVKTLLKCPLLAARRPLAEGDKWSCRQVCPNPPSFALSEMKSYTECLEIQRAVHHVPPASFPGSSYPGSWTELQLFALCLWPQAQMTARRSGKGFGPSNNSLGFQTSFSTCATLFPNRSGAPRHMSCPKQGRPFFVPRRKCNRSRCDVDRVSGFSAKSEPMF